jgi:peptidyl-prolyl cis-trans isomerase B (cyclophilin B)
MNPIISIKTNQQETIICELFPEIAPISVANFVSLVSKGFYNGLIFHRVIPGFMIQGGCPQKNGTGGPGYSIKGEFKLNRVENSLKHSKGVLSMARSQHPDSAGSQFFIMHQDAPHLDGQYAAFGQVISGMEVVDRIAKVSRSPQDRPHEEQVMVSVEVQLNGYEPIEFEKFAR